MHTSALPEDCKICMKLTYGEGAYAEKVINFGIMFYLHNYLYLYIYIIYYINWGKVVDIENRTLWTEINIGNCQFHALSNHI